MFRIFLNLAGHGSISTSSIAKSSLRTGQGIMDTNWEREFYSHMARSLGVITILAFLNQGVEHVDRLRHIPTRIVVAPNL